MLNLAVVIIGFITVGISLHLGVTFYRFPHELGKALSFAIFGGAFAGAVALLFSIYTLIGHYSVMSDGELAIYRIAIFIAVTVPDVYLIYIVRRIRLGQT